MASYNDFTKLPIYKDINRILTDPNPPVSLKVTAILHTEKKDLIIYRILSIDTIRDYSTKIADEVHLLCFIDAKAYYRDIYPYADNLEITITIDNYVLSRYDEEQVLSSITERFKAMVKPDSNNSPVTSRVENYSETELSISGLVELRCQLINRVIEPLRIKQTSGVFKNITPKDLITAILNTECNKILVDGKPAIGAIDVSPVSNTELQSNISIPTGTIVTDIPDLIQNTYAGVYSAGLGSYIQLYKNVLTWFIYPLYNYKRFEETKYNKAVFYSTDGSVLQRSEVSYREEADTIYILLTGRTVYGNDLEAGYVNKGVGFKLAHAKAYMKKPMKLTAEGVEGNDNRLNFKTANKERSDTLNYAPRSDSYISSNPYIDYSKVAARSVSLITLEWNNSAHDKIYPGMPCKYVLVVNGETKELFGTIIKAHTLVSIKGNPSTSTTYVSNTVVTIAAEKPTNFLRTNDV